MENIALVQLVNKELCLSLPEQISLQELKEKLSAHINELIQQNFEQLVSLLYRIDVSETKITGLLQMEKGANAGDIIAGLILERQWQKIKTRQQFRQKNDTMDEEEKW